MVSVAYCLNLCQYLRISTIDDFKIDSTGYLLILKLIESRIYDDIKRTEVKLEETLVYYSNMSSSDSFFNKMRRNSHSNEISNLNSEISKKKLWLSLWIKQCLEPIKSSSDLELYNNDISQILSLFKENKDNTFKLYLILEEVILSPIYGEFEGFPKGISERDISKSCELISSYLGFSADEGKKILNDLDTFIKGLNNHWGKIIKWTLAGTLVTALTAGLAAPAIAAAVGGLMGLHGVAATAAGLAFFGGGSLAAGGLGMAGGLTIIIGSGTILGAVGGYNTAKIIGSMSQEYISVSMSKLYSYVYYLHSKTGVGGGESREISNRILDKFTRLKYTIESELIMNRYTDNIDNYIKNIKIMNYTYDKLVKFLVKG